MRIAPSEVLDRSPYAAPEADLRDKSQATEDRLFSAEGRIGVWRYNARVFLGLIAMGLGGGLMFFGVLSESTGITAATSIPALIIIVVAAVMMIYAAIKRLHDLNYSGWFYLVGIIPIVGAIWTLYYALRPGAEEDNRFGAAREATTADKIMGGLGILLTILVTIGSLIPME